MRASARQWESKSKGNLEKFIKIVMTPLKKGRLIEKDLVDAPQTSTISGVLWDETFKKAKN